MSETVRADLSEARRLLGAGLRLVELAPYTKQPISDDWNHRFATRINPEATGYGLHLAENKLCSVDPDNEAQARIGLRALGFDLDALMEAGVRTRSTRPGSGGRSTFAAEGDLEWLKFAAPGVGTVMEFRADSPNLQDVIPGVVYRDKSGGLCTQTYANGRTFDEAPTLPDDFYEWWKRCSEDIGFLHEQERRFFDALGVRPHLSLSTGKGAALAYHAPDHRTAYNAQHAVEDLLAQHHYTYDRKTQRWAPPSATGAPGVRPIPDKPGLWHSDHASDPLSGTFDAWIAYVVLDHGGDLAAAKRAFDETRSAPDADRFTPIDVIAQGTGDARSRNGEGLDMSDAPPLMELRAALRAHGMLGGETSPPGEVGAEGGTANADTRDRDDDSTTARLRATWSENYGAIKATPCVVGNLIESGSLVLIYGESNTGKSTFAIDLAMTCGRGIPWRGRRTRKAVAVYLPLEGTQGVRHRVQAKIQRDAIAEPVPFADLTGHINLLDDTCVVALIAALRGLHARAPKAELVLIVDTVARAMVGGDENSSQDMGKLIGACDALRAELRCTVLLIHHAGKDTSKGARGHSSLRAAVDTEIEVAGTVNPRVVTVRKQRDLPSGDTFAFDLEPVELGKDPETFDPISACVVLYRDMPPAAQKQAGGKNQRELLAAIRGWQSNGQEIITRHELHELAKGLGGAFKRWDRRDAAISGLEERQLLTPTVGGFHVSA